MASVPKAQPGNAREEFYRRMDRDNLAPLWEVLHALVPPQPQSPCKPGYWNYKAVRPYIMEAGRVISAKEAVRRVLVLENPGLRGQSCITRSLYCGLQLILPGEIAPSHRHTQSALRFIVEGSGAFTAVNGERTTMHPGDFIITPAWTWHDHGNPGSEPVVWMDGLDIPILALFDAQFAENYSEEVQPVTVSEGTSLARYGNGLAPLDPVARSARPRRFSATPTRAAGRRSRRWRKTAIPTPATGGRCSSPTRSAAAPAMPTIGAFIQLLPKGFRSTPYRSTDSTVYSVAEGRGKVKIGSEEFTFEHRDTFIVPSWLPVSIEAKDECVLFSYSDRPAQQALGLLREQRG